ncbi:MmcQ/YjbR family DNA-binding protein [Nocardioides coralli]|uniref:MmcQ/YjbR family DNA-binding protein n=1 Tax=Nocardioides coralli TaxID=2872154 RepID=UPI001CA38CAF|nr:MmcQ/YjbR family DNA-binding protein [Nocardioides coralli]QZY29010.1 MmcQ/YjbR family DNA-binding protein [Nocardioides coralli]
MTDRAPVPEELVRRIGAIINPLPEAYEEPAWTGTRWRVGQATIAHVFGGEDQLLRITFRAEPDEVMAFEHLGSPYFRVSWGRNVVGMLLDDHTDFAELAELLVDSYCVQAPQRLVDRVDRPAAG